LAGISNFEMFLLHTGELAEVQHLLSNSNWCRATKSCGGSASRSQFQFTSVEWTENYASDCCNGPSSYCCRSAWYSLLQVA